MACLFFMVYCMSKQALQTGHSRMPFAAFWASSDVQQRTAILGVMLAIVSNLLFGVLYFYSSFII